MIWRPASNQALQFGSAIGCGAKVEIGGIAGMIGPPIRKHPADTKVWVVHEGAPAFVRADEALYVGGPDLEYSDGCPEWGKAAHSGP